jgi:putative ABC transport system ATP-binding protein
MTAGITLRGITKRYLMGDVLVQALRGVDLVIQPGEFLAIMGPSGSGKSTLLNILGCLDTPTSGSYVLDGVEVAGLSEAELAAIRNRKIGFVFQSFNLLPRIAAVEQVELPLLYAGVHNSHERRERATAALIAVGLGDRVHHHPREMSGGQQQRVAIARALVTDPSMILADEPTGALDTQASHEIMALFAGLNSARAITALVVTHETDVAAFTRRTITMRDGVIVSDGPSVQEDASTALSDGQPSPAQTHGEIAKAGAAGAARF